MKSELEQDIFRCVPKLHRKLLTRWILRLGALCLSLYGLSFFVFKAFLVFTGFRTSFLVLFILPLTILLCVFMLQLWFLSRISSSKVSALLRALFKPLRKAPSFYDAILFAEAYGTGSGALPLVFEREDLRWQKNKKLIPDKKIESCLLHEAQATFSTLSHFPAILDRVQRFGLGLSFLLLMGLFAYHMFYAQNTIQNTGQEFSSSLGEQPISETKLADLKQEALRDFKDYLRTQVTTQDATMNKSKLLGAYRETWEKQERGLVHAQRGLKRLHVLSKNLEQNQHLISQEMEKLQGILRGIPNSGNQDLFFDAEKDSEEHFKSLDQKAFQAMLEKLDHQLQTIENQAKFLNQLPDKELLASIDEEAQGIGQFRENASELVLQPATQDFSRPSGTLESFSSTPSSKLQASAFWSSDRLPQSQARFFSFQHKEAMKHYLKALEADAEE